MHFYDMLQHKLHPQRFVFVFSQAEHKLLIMYSEVQTETRIVSSGILSPALRLSNTLFLVICW